MNELARLDVMRRDLLGDVRWASGTNLPQVSAAVSDPPAKSRHGWSLGSDWFSRSPSAPTILRGATSPSDVSDRTPLDGVTRAPRSTLLMREPWEGDLR